MAQADQLVRGDQAAPAGRLGSRWASTISRPCPPRRLVPSPSSCACPTWTWTSRLTGACSPPAGSTRERWLYLRNRPRPRVGRAARPRLRLRANRVRAWPAVATGAGVGRRCQPARPGAHVGQRGGKRRGQRQRGPPGRGTGPHCLQRNLVQPPRTRRQGRIARFAVDLVDPAGPRTPARGWW